MQPQDLIPQPVQFSWCTVFSSHLLQHPLSMHHINSLVRNIYTCKFHEIPFASPTSPATLLSRALSVGAARRPSSVTREVRWYFQLPAPHPIFISSLCSRPVPGRAWVSRLLPTSGHVAHGSVSSIDEPRQPRVSSIARSRLGLPARLGSPSFTRPHLPQSL